MQTSTTKYGVEKGEDGGELVVRKQTDLSSGGESLFDIDVQFRTARTFARNVTKAVQECKTLMADPELAATMVYRLERGGEIIEGPSARLAELAMYAWGNVTRAGKIGEISDTHVTAYGIAIDFERNNRQITTVKKPIIDKNGRRFSESLIELVGRAAQSIAMRNALFQIIPGAYVRQLVEHAKAVASGGGSNLIEKRTRALATFAGLGVTEKEVLRHLGHGSVEAITGDDLRTLFGLYTAIQDGETSIEAAFRSEAKRKAKAKAEDMTTTTDAPDLPAKEDPATGKPEDAEAEGAAAGAPSPQLSALLSQAEKRFGTHQSIILQRTFSDDADGGARSISAVLAAPSTIVSVCFKAKDPAADLREIRDSSLRTEEKIRAAREEPAKAGGGKLL